MRTGSAPWTVEDHRLDGADRVDGAHRRADDRTSGLDREVRHGDAERTALVLDDRGHLGRELLGVRGVVLGRVGDPEAAAEVHLGQHYRQLVVDARVKREHPTRRYLEARGVEDLAADVGVQAQQLDAWRVQHPSHGVVGVAARDREPELLVLVGRRDVLVGVGLDTRRHPHHHPGRRGEVGGDLCETLDLGERVDDDPTDALGDRSSQLGVGLVVAVVADPGRVEARPQGHRELAGRAHVEAQVLLGHPGRHRRAEERLACVVDVVRRERLTERTGAHPEVLLVEDVGRRVVLGDEVGHGHPTDHQVAVDLVGRGRPELRHQGVGVEGLA